jgi:type II secretory ATPase GspE/PulE/Tfp pilus assembly ATPase PilB-like protein
MGAEGFLVASTVNLIIAQRLVRKICTSCIESYTLSDETRTYLTNFMSEEELAQKFYRGKGCPECNHKGYKGRIGIYEMLEVNDEIRLLIIKHVSAGEIAAAAQKNGMVPLLRDGFNKASGGITSIEEVLRVVRE